MYEEFFKLQRRPFSATPDPGCTYLAGPIQTAVDELVVCLQRGEGIAVLTAPAGFGKTLLCEKVRHELGERFVAILLRHGNFASPADLLRSLLAELGAALGNQTESDLRRHLIATLRERRQRGELIVVICDEAHCLAETVLDELRRLVDHADKGVPWVRLLLAGQLEFEERLTEPASAAVNQRLRSHVSLPSLTSAEAADYIDYRITWAGGRTEEVFRPEALRAIVEAADGVPRCLNQLCDHVLLLAYVAEQQPVGPELVVEALHDLQHLPLNWNLRAVAAPSGGRQPLDSTSLTDSGFPSPTSIEIGGNESDEPAEAEFTAEDRSDDYEQPVHRGSSIEPSPIGEPSEEPVVDRYAAIDGGWPPEETPLPITRRERHGPTQWSSTGAWVPLVETPAPSCDAPQPQDASTFVEPERQLQAEVWDLLQETRDALQGSRIETAPPESPRRDSIETAPAVAADRPFRNLFTRLRRKEQGLE